MPAGIAGTILSATAASTWTVWFVATRAPVHLETAKELFFAIAAPMWAMWLFGTWFAFSRLRAARAPEILADDPEARDVLTGEAELTGDAEAISKKIAEQIVAATSMGGMSGVRITERTSERVAFQKIKGVGGNAAMAFDSGLVTLDAQGDKVRVRYAVSQKRFARIMRIVTYLVCFLYGGAAVVVWPMIVWVYFVNSEDAAMRHQFFQIIQMIHGVWPPFLVGFLSGRLRRATSGFFETLLANLEHVV